MGITVSPPPGGSGGGTGTVGPRGPQGIQGLPGADGLPGVDGAQGPKGDPGNAGAQGPKGDPGNAGAQGPKGDQGDPGPAGSAAANGMPLALPGATTPVRFVGGTVSGPPISGNFQIGDYVVTQAAEEFVCTVAGTPGTWVRVAGGGQYLTGVDVTTDQTVASGGGTVDITGAAITYTFDGSPIEVRFELSPYCTVVGGIAHVFLLEDGVVVREAYATISTANGQITIGRSCRRTPTPGAHTYKLQFTSLGASNVVHTNGQATIPVSLFIRKA